MHAFFSGKWVPVGEIVRSIGDTAVAGHWGEGEEGADGDVGGGLDLHGPVVDWQLKVIHQQNAQNDLADRQIRFRQRWKDLRNKKERI